ncbi:MAG: hypothetical protein ABUS48_05620 [Pseudomonadota bacterium]
MQDPEFTTRDEVLGAMRGIVQHGVPFDHFKLFYESAERVTDRRIALNHTNASLACLIAGGIGVLAAWALGQQKKEIAEGAILVLAFVSLLAAAFSRWWWKQIEAYKDLNRSKFAVLKEMARNIVFVNTEKPPVCTFDPFLWEWELSKKADTLSKYKDTLALGSSWSELIVPKAFLCFFLSVAFAAVVVFVLKLVVK